MSGQRYTSILIVDVYKPLYSDPAADSAFEESLVWGFQCEQHPGDDTHITAFEEDTTMNVVHNACSRTPVLCNL